MQKKLRKMTKRLDTNREQSNGIKAKEEELNQKIRELERNNEELRKQVKIRDEKCSNLQKEIETKTKDHKLESERDEMRIR